MQGCAPSPLLEMTCGFQYYNWYSAKKTMWFIGVEVEQETSAPPPKKNPGSAPVEQACWAQQRKQETSARRFTCNKVGWNFNFFIGFTICPFAERYFRNGVCRLSYHASMRPLVWIRYSIRCPNRDAVLHIGHVLRRGDSFKKLK